MGWMPLRVWEHEITLDLSACVARRPAGWPARCVRCAAPALRHVARGHCAGSACVARRRTPVSRWGDLQHLADRLDPMRVPRLIDKRPHDLSRRSSSAWAKNALASFSISLARRNSLTSRSSTLMRACSAVLRPSRWPCVPLVLTHPVVQGRCRAANLARNGNHGCPLRFVLGPVLEHHPHRTFADFGGELRRFPHGSIFSRLGASSNPGAGQLFHFREKAFLLGDLPLVQVGQVRECDLLHRRLH